MQAKLPDINSAIVRHRTGCLVAAAQLNYSLAATEIGAINALLPEDYKVKEDSEEYYNIIKNQDVMVCNYCEKETDFSGLVFYNKAPELTVQLLYKIESISMWNCPHCFKQNPKEGSTRKIRVIQNPFYTGYMPYPPKKAMFGNEKEYKKQFDKWFDIALNELECKIGLYRTDYAAQQDGDAAEFEDEDDNGVS